MEKWQRDLPFEELLFDRWARARSLGFGARTSVYHSCYVYGRVKVGHDTWIGPFTVLDGTGELKIGDYCSISAGVQIYTHNSVKWAVTAGQEPYDKQPVTIGNYCFIGPNSVVKNGVTIGEHCVIAAMSFVNQNIPPRRIAAGVPAKVIGRVIVRKGKATFEYFKKTNGRHR
jgi:acetyltransferase-like isoleucine patch superfamily enzyme